MLNVITAYNKCDRTASNVMEASPVLFCITGVLTPEIDTQTQTPGQNSPNFQFLVLILFLVYASLVTDLRSY